MITILPLKNPNALELPEIAALMDAAFKNVEYKRARDFLADSIGSPHEAVFLARYNDEWQGMAWVRNPTLPDDTTSTVLHLYNRRRKDVRDELVKTVVTFAKEAGSDTLLAWDINRKPRAFERIFKDAGPAREVIRAHEFDLTQAKW